jgi:hypothetical protein
VVVVRGGAECRECKSKSVVGNRNFNLRRSQIRKMGKIGLN